MKGMFSMDSPLMGFLTKVADLIIINLLFIFVSIPIITIGAGYSAMYSVLMKLVKDEEGVISKQFFAAFKENFKQATIVWVPLMLISIGLIYDYIVVRNGNSPKSFELLIIVMGAVILIFFINYFPIIAKFENTLLNSIKNALVVGLTHIVKTIFMAVFILVPWALTYKRIEIFPVFVMLGCSLPVFVNSIWFNGIYEKMIENYSKKETEEAQPDDEAIKKAEIEEIDKNIEEDISK